MSIWKRDFPPNLRIATHERDGRHCKLCGIAITLEEMQADHKVPFGLPYSGKTNMANGQALCGPCNGTKGKSVDPADLTDPEKCDLAGYLAHEHKIRPGTKQAHAAVSMMQRLEGTTNRGMMSEIGITAAAVRGLLYTDLRPKKFAFTCDMTQSPPRYYAT